MLGAIIAVLFFTSSANATVWYVHPDSTLNSIQTALDSCADNDTVLVAPGIYIEDILWPNTQGIHLSSESGPDITIIHGLPTPPHVSVIRITTMVDSATIIEGFTIRNGFAGSGGGIYISGSSPSIINNIIIDNEANSEDFGCGGGISCMYNSSPLIMGNTITENRAVVYGGPFRGGGGIYCRESSPTIINNVITFNYSDDVGGGLLFFFCSSPPTVANNIIAGNINGGIWCRHASPAITCNTIIAHLHYGIECHADASPIISDNTIIENEYGIYCGGPTSPQISWNMITDNINIGVQCGYGTSPTIDHCVISRNCDGIYCHDGATPIIHHNNIVDNSGYGVINTELSTMIDAENNWWGDASGPYHPTANPGGLGDTVSDYVGFDPWLTGPGIGEQPIVKPVEEHENLTATIFRGPLQLPEGKECKVFDITGRIVEPDRIQPGVYFVEVDGIVTQKVIKIR